MNKRGWTVFLGSAALLIAGLTIFLLNGAKEAEKKVRIQKEVELSKKMVELSEKQGQIASLIKEKTELEEQSSAKIASLEAAIRDYEENAKAFAAKVEALTRDSETLKQEIGEKDRKLSELLRKVRQLEVDKADLVSSINKQAEGAVAGSDESADSPQSPAFQAAGANPVKLGKIVVRKSSGRAAKVEYVDAAYGFILINAGHKDDIRPNSVVNILRGDRLIGKAVVQKVKADVSAAVILPDWTREEVRVGDLVSKFS